MTSDTESIARHLGIEFPEDLYQVTPKRPFKPPVPVRHVADHDGCIRWGRTLGQDRQSLLVVASN
jgi:hypothetical protein